MLTTATATRRKLDYNDETDISESDKYDLEEKSEVEGNEEDEDVVMITFMLMPPNIF